MFNQYNRGFQDGLTAGSQGKNKNYQVPTLSAIVSQKNVETYCRGYDQGHRNGLREFLQKEKKMQKSITDDR